MTMPALKCPRCARDLEYHVTLERTTPPIGKIDTGYCAACAQLVERVRETGTYYETTAWPPLCRECRQPVVFFSVGAEGSESALYHCTVHQQEQWTWNRSTERWVRIERR